MFANKTTKDGCLEFGLGDKKILSVFEYDKHGQGELDSKIVNNLEWKTVETTPRDLLLFDSYIPHRSGENKTDKARRIFYFTYNEEKFGNLYNKYIENKRKYFPPNIERSTINLRETNII